MNPLLDNSNLEFEAIDFTKIKVEHFLPALDASIKEAKDNLEKLKKIENPTFENTIIAQENSADRLDLIVEIFYALHSAHCTDELNAIAESFNQKLTEYGSDVSLDEKLFEKVNAVYKQKESLNLTGEDIVLLERAYKGFTRNGALLTDDKKDILRKIDQDLSKLSLDFSENIRKANAKYLMVIESEKDIEGMPEGVIEAAKELAVSKGHNDGWAFSFDFPSYYPLMQYCKNEKIREEISTKNGQKNLGGEFDNSNIVLNILKKRLERATLLGYKDHPEFVLENRMAKSANRVMDFIEEITLKSQAQAKVDFKKLSDLKKELTGSSDFHRYDAAMYTELLKKKELDFDDEELRPYFKLENVLDGIFKIANKLYGLNFKLRSDLPKYHEDVLVYEVRDKNNEYVGLYYGDFFPRAEKRPGAWMTTFRSAGLQFGEIKRPFVCNVCNFTKPTNSKPSLLNLDEVLTLFHEFGHGLHGLLSKAKYKSVGGTNVHWDFVELPSQIMENWVLEKECLDLFAVHYKTGEKIPEALVQKIKKSRQFLEGLGTLRQMSFSKLDMKIHLEDPSQITDVKMFEDEVLKELDLYKDPPKGCMSTSFGHIFSGGYSAGYYSYKWAEVLDADAFAFFKEKGIFDPEVARSFMENILEKGGSEDPMDLYIKFRGREPSIDALLERAGLL